MRFLFVDLEADWGGPERYAFWLMLALRARGHWVGCVAALPDFEPACDQLWIMDGRADGLRRSREVIEEASVGYGVDVVHYNADRAIHLAPLVRPHSRSATVATRYPAPPTSAAGRARASIDDRQTDLALHRVGHCLSVPPAVLTELIEAARARTVHLAFGGSECCPQRVVRPVTDRVAFVGRLSRENGVGDLLALARRSAARPPARRRFRLCVAGNGPLADEVARHERALSPAVIEYRGRFGDPDGVYASTAALLVPSWNVGTPSLVSRAFSWAVPAVAYDTHAAREVIADGRNGILVRSADSVDGLERALDWLLRYPADCIRLGWAARADYEAGHRGEIIIDRTIVLLEQTASRAALGIPQGDIGETRADEPRHAGRVEPIARFRPNRIPAPFGPR